VPSCAAFSKAKSQTLRPANACAQGAEDGHSPQEPAGPSEVTEIIAAAACRLMEQTVTLLKWALIFFLVSIVAGVFGFTGISVASADVARFLFYVFVVIFLVLLVLGLTVFRA
jgi:uncharacterized membrane protein YtjA (UPF0391 family)